VTVRPDGRRGGHVDLLIHPHGAAESDHRLQRRPGADTRAHPRRLDHALSLGPIWRSGSMRPTGCVCERGLRDLSASLCVFTAVGSRCERQCAPAWQCLHHGNQPGDAGAQSAGAAPARDRRSPVNEGRFHWQHQVDAAGPAGAAVVRALARDTSATVPCWC
jgi:hypothetical protein